MDYSLWMPEAIVVVRALGFVDGIPHDRTRDINIQRSLASTVFLEDDVTLLDVSSNGHFSASTLVVTTSPAAKGKVKELLAANHYGGPILGLGSLRVPGMMKALGLLKNGDGTQIVRLGTKPLFHVSALSSGGDPPNSVNCAKQQLRLASCCAARIGGIRQTLVDNGILSNEEVLLEGVVSGYLERLCNHRAIVEYRSGMSAQYWTQTATALCESLERPPHVSAPILREALLELKALPVDRCLHLLKKEAKQALADRKYIKARKHYLKDEKASLEGVLAKPLAEYVSQSRATLYGVELLVDWISGKSAGDEAAAYVSSALDEDNSRSGYSRLAEALEKLYLALPTKPLDVVATFVLGRIVSRCRVNMASDALDLTTSTGARDFIEAASVGALLPQDVKDQMLRNLDALVTDVSIAGRSVLSGERNCIANICAVLESAKANNLLK